MRITRIVIIAVTVAVLALFGIVNPVFSYQFGQNPQVLNPVEQSIQPRMLIAEYGCDGAHDARDSLNSARESESILREVFKEDNQLRQAAREAKLSRKES